MLFPRYSSIATLTSTAAHITALTAISMLTMTLPEATSFQGAKQMSPLTLEAKWLNPRQPPETIVQIAPLPAADEQPVATATPIAQRAAITRQQAERAVSDRGKHRIPSELLAPGRRNVNRADEVETSQSPSHLARLPKRQRSITPPEVKVAPPQKVGTDERTPPNYSVTRAPKYPPQAQALGHEGEVVLRLFVNARGHVERAEVVETSGYAELDQAAIDAVTTWRGRPAMQNGRAVATTEKLRIQFRIPR